MNKIVLCCGRRRCPIVEKIEEGYKLTDDYGGIVILSSEQMKMLQESDVDSLAVF
jgi:hypothetical protein